MSEIVDFLLARFAEDERVLTTQPLWLAPPGHELLTQFGDFGDDERWMIEIPAPRLRAEIEAKRRIMAMFAGDADISAVCALLALPYADHPDYRQEWRP